MRCIDADALETHEQLEPLGNGQYECVEVVYKDDIDNAPTIEPERKTGKWIYGEDDGQDGWYCSECGGFVHWDYDYYGLGNIDFIKDFKTCPRCDARMISYTGMEEGEQE